MTIKTKISFKEYLKLLYTLTYQRALLILILFVDFVMICWIVGYYSDLLPVPEPTFYQFTTVTLITIVQPLVIFNTIWKNYHSSCHLKEEMEMEFTPYLIKMRGDSFYTELVWSKIYKVQELKSWFMIYQNSLSAIIIPKKAFQRNQEEEFKLMLQSIPKEKVHLKKD